MMGCEREVLGLLMDEAGAQDTLIFVSAHEAQNGLELGCWLSE
jgi:hypothetical protein